MKKLLLGVITFALIITSCNKYADDFQELKDSIAKLSTTVNGVVKLQADLTATQAQITALQAVVATLPTATVQAGQFAALTTSLTGVTTTLAGITTTLNAVALAGTANKAVVDKLAVDLAKVVTDKAAADLALNAKLDALKTELKTATQAGDAATQAQITSLQTAMLAAITANGVAVNENVDAKVAAASTAIQNAITAGLAATDANVNTKIAAAQAALMTALDESVAALQAAILADIDSKTAATDANVDAKIAALQAVLETGLASTDANVNTKIDAVLAALAAASAATDANVDAKLAALESSLGDAITAILAASSATDANVDAKIAALETALTLLINTGNTANLAQIQLVLDGLAAQTLALQGDPTNTDATQLTIQGLQLALAKAQSDIAVILINTSMYNGDVSITTNAEYDFFLAKINQLGIVNGNLKVDPTTISDPVKRADVNTILARIQAVIGTTGNVTITNTTADALALPLLTSVKGWYSVTGADVSDPVLNNVGGSVLLNYGGAYESTSLMAVGGDLMLVNNTAVPRTTTINFPSVVVGGKVGDVATGLTPPTASGVVTFNNAGTTSINLAGGVSSLTANNALSIRLGSAVYATALSISSTNATDIDLSACTSITVGGITLATPAATTINLSNFTTTTVGVSISGAAACNLMLNKFNANIPVSITGVETVSLPLWVGGAASTFNAPAAKTVTLAKNAWNTAVVPATANLAAVETLTLGAVNNPVALDAYPTLKTVSITGVAPATYSGITYTALTTSVTATATSAALESLTVAGTIKTVNVAGVTTLKSVATSGIINSFIINGCSNAALTSLGLTHTHFPSGPGSTVNVINCDALTSLTTSTNYPLSLIITDNGALTGLNLASNIDPVTTVAAGVSACTFTISNNKLSGVYVPSIPALGSDPRVEPIIKSNKLLPLKAIVAAIFNPTGIGATSMTGLQITLDDVDASTTGLQLLTTAMAANKVADPLIVVDDDGTAPKAGITLKQEAALLAAE